MDFPPLGYFLVIFSGTLLEFQIGRAPPEGGGSQIMLFGSNIPTWY